MRVVRGLVVVMLAGAVVAGPLDHLDAVASARQKSTDTVLREQSTNAGTPAEKSALARARGDGRPVEVESMRTETRQVFAQPGGTLLLEQYARPVRVRKAGGWVAADAALRFQPDGTIAPVATSVDLRFSGGGGAPLARMA